jgi:hypothetical protein
MVLFPNKDHNQLCHQGQCHYHHHCQVVPADPADPVVLVAQQRHPSLVALERPVDLVVDQDPQVVRPWSELDW